MTDYLVVFHGFEAVPEVASIADEVPSDFLFIEVELVEHIVVAFLHGFELLFGCFLCLGER